MIKIDTEKTIHITRGDSGTIIITAKDNEDNNYVFKANDILRLKIMKQKNVENVLLVKDVTISSNTTIVEIELNSKDTKLENYINKPVTYWYEIELNPDSEKSTTIIGYDEDGPKKIKLYPECKETNYEH